MVIYMPLRCSSNNGEISSYNLSSEEWDALKANYRDLGLRMACCGMPAIPKTSSLGTSFFAHSRRGECTSAPETKEHLLAKTIVAKAAIEAGWKVTTECRGNSGDGAIWIADVLAEHENARIAFEVQWSTQGDNTTAYRQRIYRDAGIRSMWLFKQPNFKSNKETPGFRLTPNSSLDGFMVKIPKNISFFDGKDDYYWSQSIELKEFIMGCLSKKLSWSLSKGIRLPVRFDGVSIRCWKCKKPTTILLGIAFELGKKFKGCDDLICSIYDFEKNQNVLQSLLPRELYIKYGVGVIRTRFSKTVGNNYISNGCTHCDAIQGQFFEHEYVHEAEEIMRTEIEITEPILTALKASEQNYNHWYFMK